MLNSLTAPVLAILISIPGLGILPGFHLRGPRVKAPVDSLPPAWKPASRLSIEDDFVFAALGRPDANGSGIRIGSDPRQTTVSVDADSDAITLSPEIGEVPLGMTARHSFSAYSRDMSWQSFRQQWQDRSRQNINTLSALGTAAAPTTGLQLKLPYELPKQIQGWLGPGSPALNISGSENIRLSGQSNWSNQTFGTPLGQKKSIFPSLDMQQDLDIRLEGQLSDRVRVNLLQNSGIQIPLANRIAINYKGDEDDLIQQLDLGNTSLSLPGTQYVSYSGKNEGLFGVKVGSRFGPLDVSLLASKQEGRSERATYAGGASKQTPQPIRDFDYIRGQYFMLYDPNDPNGPYDIPDSSIRLYLDEGTYSDLGSTIRGWGLVQGDTANLRIAGSVDSASLHRAPHPGAPVAVRGTFKKLNPGGDQDFEVYSNLYGPAYKIIKLRQQIGNYGTQILAVSYQRQKMTRNPDGTFVPTGPIERIGGADVNDVDGRPARTMKLLWIQPNLMKSANADNFDTSLALTPVRELEMRNFYDLHGQRIDPKTMKLSIRYGSNQPPVVNANTDVGQIPFIEILGLDNLDETSGNLIRGHDGLVDASAINTTTRAFVDFDTGILFFYDLRPFAPRIAGPGAKPFEIARSAELNRRKNLLNAAADGAVLPNPAIYEKYSAQRDIDGLYYMDLEFTAQSASGEISLGRSNIVEGSEVVSINGQALQRDRDYTVDYDLGRVTLKRQLGPSDNLAIDYAYAPLFQQAGKTLLGSAFRFEGRDKSFGGAFMYESKGAQDLRPRLGEEPSRTLIGDLNTAWTFRPTWMTRFIDHLPGVRTTAPSEVQFQAEVGVSSPNPNTRGVVYIDDMEGVRDAVSLSMGQDRWRISSRPADVAQRSTQRKAEIHWFSPYSVVKERELKPTLTDAQGAQNSHQVLALSVPRRPATFEPGDRMWTGLTYPLDAAGLDLHKSQFIELWINDFKDPAIRAQHVKVHVDLGVVSEDQMRYPDAPPNGVLDTEDKSRDNQLILDEDTGIDGLETAGAEADSIRSTDPAHLRTQHDLSTASPNDPEGDDYDSPDEHFKEIDPRRWRRINGSQGNRLVLPVPDSEDLNVNNNLDVTENYFEYTIDLGDSNYVATDVSRDFPGVPPPPTTGNFENGWRRYRIPIADSLRTQVGVPDLNLARHVRVWIEDLEAPDPDPDANNLQRPLMMLGGVDIVGSRWQLDLDAGTIARGTSGTLNSVNSTDNAEIYVPPFDPGETRAGSQGLARREQSLALEFTELAPDDTLEAYRNFSIDEDYSRYGKLAWFVTGFDVEGGTSAATPLQYFVRFATDERSSSYYEYRAPVPVAPGTQLNWNEVKVDITEFSSLKLNADFPLRDTVYTRPRSPGSLDTLVIKGRPSFTRLRRISMGLINPTGGTTTFRRGQLWFDELRATEVAKDRGQAQRINFSGQASNLFSYNFVWDGRNADFLSVGETRGLGSTTNNITAGTTFNTQRFFEGTGIVLPVTLGYQRGLSSPRFNAGDDVVRSGAQSQASESFAQARSVSAQYSRNWSERSNPLLRYTLGGITANMSYGDANEHNPNQTVQRHSNLVTVDYRIAPRRLLAIPLPLTRARLQPLPDQFYWTYDVGNSWSQTTDRVGLTGQLLPRDPVSGRTAAVRFGATTRPFDSFTHTFSGIRNQMLGGSPQHFGFLYLGKVVNWNQTMSTRYTMNRGAWLNPSFNWNSGYGQDNGPALSPDLSVRSVRNNQTVTVAWNLPFDRLAPVSIGVPGVRDTTHRRGPSRSPLRGLLSWIGNVSTDANVNWNSSYSRLRGTPSLLYLAGLTQNPGPQGIRGPVVPDFGNTFTKSYDWRAGARTRLALILASSVNTSADISSSISSANSVESRRNVVRFPDFQVDYGRIPNLVGLAKLLKDPKLQTSFTRSQTTEYNDGLESSQLFTSDWRPMMSLHGDLRNGTRLELTVNRRVTKNIRRQLGESITTDRNADVSLGINRSYSQGQKVNILGRESTVRSTVNLGFTTKYERQSGETVQQGRALAQLPTLKDRLSVNATGQYGFSNNVTGNVSLGFGQDRDALRKTVNRNVRVELRAQFTF